jgi:hypothetical protein
VDIKRLAATAVAALALGGVGETVAATSASASASSGASVSASGLHGTNYNQPYVLYMSFDGNEQYMQVRPHNINLVPYVQGGEVLIHLHWTSWNSQRATGYGDYTGPDMAVIRVRVLVDHPAWLPAPQGPTEYRVFHHVRISTSRGTLLFTWHQDYAMGGHYSWSR